jgi:hypothetical protein
MAAWQEVGDATNATGAQTLDDWDRRYSEAKRHVPAVRDFFANAADGVACRLQHRAKPVGGMYWRSVDGMRYRVRRSAYMLPHRRPSRIPSRCDRLKDYTTALTTDIERLLWRLWQARKKPLVVNDNITWMLTMQRRTSGSCRWLR